ncbi:MAG: DUF2029 domain-containing protein, partial [Verrucomicrobiota bacterium]|nr:DUF2029 domain-containing protein [Verrucomicrobiota bacterium]
MLLVVVAPIALRLLRANTEDFGYFYSAANAMRHGEDIYRAAEGNYIYPPLLAFLFQPLTFLPERGAMAVWLVISAASIVTAVFIAANEAAMRWLPIEPQFHRDHVWGIAGIALLLNVDKLHKTFGLGQTDSLIVLAGALVLCWMNRRPALAGIAIGASANIKYLTLIFVPYFLLKRNFRAALSSIVSFVFFLALPAVEIGLERATHYAMEAFSALGRMIGLTSAKQTVQIFSVTWHRSVSITSAVFRLTRSQGLSDLLAVGLTLLAFAVIMAAIVFAARRNGVRIFDRDSASERLVSLEWAVLIFLALAFSPQTSSRHMILALLIYVLAVAIYFAQPARGPRILLAVAGIIFALSLSFPLGGRSSHA